MSALAVSFGIRPVFSAIIRHLNQRGLNPSPYQRADCFKASVADQELIPNTESFGSPARGAGYNWFAWNFLKRGRARAYMPWKRSIGANETVPF